MKRPEDQFQIGERVLYVQEGVIARVEGYRWKELIGGPPEIIGYHLDCGITVGPKDLAKWRRPIEGPPEPPLGEVQSDRDYRTLAELGRKP